MGAKLTTRGCQGEMLHVATHARSPSMLQVVVKTQTNVLRINTLHVLYPGDDTSIFLTLLLLHSYLLVFIIVAHIL